MTKDNRKDYMKKLLIGNLPEPEPEFLTEIELAHWSNIKFVALLFVIFAGLWLICYFV